MGLVHASVMVFSPDYQRSEEVRVLVDTGSTLTWLPEDLLTRMGLRPSGIAGFRTADDRTVERPIADVAIGCEGTRGVVRVAFARPGDANVLGVTALETLGFEVDPIARALRKVDRYLALRFLSMPVESPPFRHDTSVYTTSDGSRVPVRTSAR